MSRLPNAGGGRREQFHDLRIGESVMAYSLSTQARVDAIQQGFIGKGSIRSLR